MTTNPPSGLPEEHEKKSAFKPILITLLCSFLLAGGSCFAALRTFNYNSGGGTSWGVFMVIFLAAALTFSLTCVWLIVRAIRMAVDKKR
jgi:hypothetical protein